MTIPKVKVPEVKDFGDRFKTVATEDSYDIFRGASYALKWGQQCGRTNTAAMRAMKVLGATCNAFYLPFLIGDYNALRHKTCELFTGKDVLNKRVGKFGLSLSDATCDTCGFVEALHFHKILSVGVSALSWVGALGGATLITSFGKRTVTTLKKCYDQFREADTPRKVLLLSRLVKNIAFLAIGVFTLLAFFAVCAVMPIVFLTLGTAAAVGAIFSQKVDGVCWLFSPKPLPVAAPAVQLS